ncbi:MAG: glucokinase, partial [Pontibacterium sp.]
MSDFSLVGDIGGTNARFALVAANSLALKHIHTYKCDDFENIDAACKA